MQGGLQPADPGAHRIYGVRVEAPCAGQVLHAVNGLPDMRVPAVGREHVAGKHVMLFCADGTAHAATHADVVLGHLQRGCMRVTAGAAVAVGDGLGCVGRSGNTTGPHLHIYAQSPGPDGAPLGGDRLPSPLASGFAANGDRIEPR